MVRVEGEELERAVLGVPSEDCSFSGVLVFFNEGQHLYQRPERNFLQI